MEKLILEFNETGPCKVDVTKITETWDDRFSISQWNNEYRFIKQKKLLEEPVEVKATISEDQAKELIKKVGLLPIPDSFFASGTTWRTKSNIISEKDRIQAILDKSTDTQEMRVLRDIIYSYNQALKHGK
jgi:hypothetical protein